MFAGFLRLCPLRATYGLFDILFKSSGSFPFLYLFLEVKKWLAKVL